MKIAYISDIHLEFGDLLIKNEENADILILAGDVCVADDIIRHPWATMDQCTDKNALKSELFERSRRYKAFFGRCAQLFPIVLYVMGNHEHYGGKLEKTSVALKENLSIVSGNIHLLEKSFVKIDDMLFYGATFWTSMNQRNPHVMWDAKRLLNDYNFIRLAHQGYRKLSPEDTVDIFYETLSHAKAFLQEYADSKIVMISHHAPCWLSVPQKLHGHVLNEAYYSNIDLILECSHVKLWVHGHIHNSVAYELAQTSVRSNPRGYYGSETFALEANLKYFDV